MTVNTTLHETKIHLELNKMYSVQLGSTVARRATKESWHTFRCESCVHVHVHVHVFAFAFVCVCCCLLCSCFSYLDNFAPDKLLKSKGDYHEDESGNVSVEFAHELESESAHLFSGNQTGCKELDYLLIYDPETGVSSTLRPIYTFSFFLSLFLCVCLHVRIVC